MVYKAFLKYLYTGVIDLPAEKALGESVSALCDHAQLTRLKLTVERFVAELLDLANVYCENNLKRRCIQMIKQGITIANVAFLYSTAIEYNAEVTTFHRVVRGASSDFAHCCATLSLFCRSSRSSASGSH